MEEWFQSRSSERSFLHLLEIRLVRVVVIGFEITKRRGEWIQTVVRDDHELRVAELGEGLHVEPEVRLCVVALRGCDVCPVGQRIPGEQTDAGIMAAF